MLPTLLVIAVLLLVLVIANIVLVLRRTGHEGEPESRVEQAMQDGFKEARETRRDEFERARDVQSKSASQLREEVGKSLAQASDTLVTTIKALGDTQATQLAQLQANNEKKLEQMRQTVDEKLQGTLEKRLGESFAQVSKRLEEVHRGLGEMKGLADGVGDLKRVLSNVKARGTWGEVQLRAILEQILTDSQYEENVETVPGSNARVEFAVRLPGPMDGMVDHIWLPIDSKFPMDYYARLQDAMEQSDTDVMEAAAKELEQSIFQSAKEIKEKYVSLPYTTDFAILFLPVEGLYGEVLRRSALFEKLQELRITVAGPTTLTAILNSLRMGFRTLAIEQRSSEVWEVLGAVKAEFEKFGGVLDKLKKQLGAAQNTIDQGRTRTRVMEKKLRDVESLPEGRSDEILQLPEFHSEEADEHFEDPADARTE
ncbi:MAG: DNA recombination protein RmuC [Phycisphaerales bacterium]|nr:DNA recombination protein RmuC [Phycisphaerales bacterium]